MVTSAALLNYSEVATPGRRACPNVGCGKFIGVRSLKCPACQMDLAEFRARPPKPARPAVVSDVPTPGRRACLAGCGKYVQVRLKACPSCHADFSGFLPSKIIKVTVESASDNLPPDADTVAIEATIETNDNKYVAPVTEDVTVIADEDIKFFVYGSFNGAVPDGIYSSREEADAAWAAFDKKLSSIPVLIGCVSEEAAESANVKALRNGIDKAVAFPKA